ncbi:glycosyltransferase [Mycobacterium sp. SMC-18]|uniref:glycosyltransferase n=1 Tax=Mycobacteriaceae TaxID=1762 RepID=UPI00299F0A3F|nr:glycosyltransferase [Mycolicibacterium sp. 141076]MDX1877103.1 glycosyltransferase [Mycolicibacterium sp. 141076]
MTADREQSVLVWHVHGAWMESFVAGPHRYLVPVGAAAPDRDARGLCGRSWPRAQEIPLSELAAADVDLVVLQRPGELDEAQRWLRRRPGVDVPAVYVEHNAPRPNAVDSVHPLADRRDIPLIHVTEFNRLMWDNGIAPTKVIDHGIADPGPLYTGDIAGAAAMINEPLRRWRTVGADLLGELSRAVPIEVWGIDTKELNRRQADPRDRLRGKGDIPAPELWRRVARRRVYLHTARWTSLGLSLVEAMYLGMPIVAVASTMAPLVVPSRAGVVGADVKVLSRGLLDFVNDPAAAALAGKAAREFAAEHFALDRFLADWNRVIDDVCH